MKLAISAIKIGERYRKEMGDLKALADSIAAEGLLQPIGVTEAHELVFGERRLVACRDVLKWTEIEARVVNVSSILAGEYAENTLRKDFTPSERVAIAKAVQRELGNRQGARTELPHNRAEVAAGRETREIVAERAGFGSHATLRRAEVVVERGVPELVEAMDSGDVSISAAAEVARLPAQEQQVVMEKGPAAVRQARELTFSRKAQYKHPAIKLENIANTLETVAEAMQSLDPKRTAEIPAERLTPCLSRITEALRQIRQSTNGLNRMAS